MEKKRRAGAGNQAVGESEVLNLITDAFDRYEEKTGQPRHAENVQKFQDLFEVLNKMKGAMWACGLPVALVAVTVGIIQIVKFAKGH